MSKHIQRRTGKHPLARVREILGIGQKGVLEKLGIAPATCAHIESGRTNDGKPYRLSPKCASRISAWTGLSEACLLKPNGKLLTVSGERFTKATYARVAAERDTVINPARKSGNEAFHFFLLLIAKLGRVMLAAQTDAKPRPDIVWQLRSEMVKLGSVFPAWESKELNENRAIKNPTEPELFDWGIQKLIASYNGKRLPLPKIGAAILLEFDRSLGTIESAKQPANKPKAKAAKRKPTRR